MYQSTEQLISAAAVSSQTAASSCMQIATTVSQSPVMRTMDVAVLVVLGLILLRLFLSILKTKQIFSDITASEQLIARLPLRAFIGLDAVHDDEIKQNYVTVVSKLLQPAEVIGWLKPRIILSQTALVEYSKKELEAILLHELWHANKSHALWTSLVRTVTATCFMFPVLRDLEKYLQLKFETDADAFVVATQRSSRHLKTALSKTLGYSTPSYFPGMASQLAARVNSLQKATTPQLELNSGRLTVSLLIATLFGLYLYLSSQTTVMAQQQHPQPEPICTFQQCVRNCLTSNLQSSFEMQSRGELPLSSKVLE